MTENLHKVSINNKSYGELNRVVVYLTDDLYKRLEKQQSRQGTLLDAFKMGRALQGQKHIISLVKESTQGSNIVFNLEKTEKVGNKYFINYDEYRQKSRARFFPLYRQTGLDAARFYLSSYLPKEFEYTPDQLKESEIKKVNKQLPRVLSELSVKDKNKVAIIEEATKTIRRLKRRTRALKEALADLQRQSNLSFYQQSLDELKTRLTKNYPEVKGANSWQRWIYRNDWLFGVQYLTPIERERVGFDNIPDFLFPTPDGFIDILEIKRPNFDTIREDPEHRGSYMWCPETNKAIGQVVNYIQHMELHQLELAQKINDKYGEKYPIPIQSIKPRASILIGNAADWRRRPKEAFRTLNYSLHGIEVLTYDDLIKRGESIVSMLSRRGD